MKWRFKFVLLAYLSLLLLVVFQLAYWQLIRKDELRLLGQSQYGRLITLYPRRGEIKTSDNYSIAANRVSYHVYANPKLIEDSNVASQIIAPLIDEDTASISSLLNQDKFWVSLKKNATIDEKKKLEELKIPGIGFEEQYVRYYPEASMAAHLVGFLGKDQNGQDLGYVGLEGRYDRELKGKAINAYQIHDALDRPILSKIDDPISANDGRSLVLNIDRPIQFLVETELKKGIEKFGAHGGLVIVMDPKTGALISLASFPTFDPRSYWDYEEKLYVNPIISSTYEPGSTFKPIIMASAIDNGDLKADTKCDICSGPISLGGFTIKTWNNKYNANLTMTDVIKNSDNTGMVFTTQKLGLKKTYDYLQKFGFGDLTGIDLQGEVTSSLRPIDDWRPIDLATTSFGQGISITPIQLISAFSSIANKGIRMQPQVVDKVELSDGEILDIKPKELGRTVSYKTAVIMTEMLVNAVENGEAKWTKVDGYRIAGKTGTAQIPIAGRYDPNKTIPSFIGFAPADNPKFIMLVVLDRPETSIYGSETAAPIFFNIARQMLLYYGINPSK